ncbi:nitroreductase family deazaflavin-dependent oxidoreductase [Saccharothrix luteola]|uniref:nitroreductase family deazaflavin-dependent oxidoreductase n=1 Tax=Saccharothrix luteola TaxID=2893018 RepID=UPI001E42B7FB|nr:nitroreductase family deazaflavin-dependent oxidoreductase [Saccharothrix luteola]MCC8250429.1 nitroreductase family deazaflavin-dependent oxidoreductase [Saccharothrix luteola]
MSTKASEKVPAPDASREEVFAWNAAVLEEYRANGGRVGGAMAGMDLLLLTTTGARSGKPRSILTLYYGDGDRYLVVASNFGKPRHPDWYHNLVSTPEVTVEVAGEQFAAHAVVLDGAERDQAFDTVAGRYPFYAGYQAGVTRTIPVVALIRADRA